MTTFQVALVSTTVSALKNTCLYLIGSSPVFENNIARPSYPISCHVVCRYLWDCICPCCPLRLVSQLVFCSTGREQVTVLRLRTGHKRFNYHLYSRLRIQSSAIAVLAVRQQNISCSPAPSTSHSERKSGQTTLP